MLGQLFTYIRQHVIAGLIPEGKIGLALIGHRNYVGGKWDQIGALQYEFLLSQGLEPKHILLDIGCGALRGGVHFIDYLIPGHYIGVDKEQAIVSRGLSKEVSLATVQSKQPFFIITDSFDFSNIPKVPSHSLAVSLFTHLSLRDIRQCLTNLYGVVRPGHLFYATFFEGSSQTNRARSHSLDHFEYSVDEIKGAIDHQMWKFTYLGDWNHPRNQMMCRFEALGPAVPATDD